MTAHILTIRRLICLAVLALGFAVGFITTQTGVAHSAVACQESNGAPYQMDPGNPGFMIAFPQNVTCSGSSYIVVACPFIQQTDGTWAMIGNCTNNPPGCGTGNAYSNGTSHDLYLDWSSQATQSCSSIAQPGFNANEQAAPDGFPVINGVNYLIRYRFWDSTKSTIFRTVNSNVRTCC